VGRFGKHVKKKSKRESLGTKNKVVENPRQTHWGGNQNHSSWDSPSLGNNHNEVKQKKNIKTQNPTGLKHPQVSTDNSGKKPQHEKKQGRGGGRPAPMAVGVG